MCLFKSVNSNFIGFFSALFIIAQSFNRHKSKKAFKMKISGYVKIIFYVRFLDREISVRFQNDTRILKLLWIQEIARCCHSRSLFEAELLV